MATPTNMNPLISNNTVELALNEFLFPSLYNFDPETRAPMKGGRNDQDNGLALDWSISDDGLVYSFTLRDDVTWNDGTPVTAFDYKFTFDALASGETSSPRTDVLQSVESVEAVDATTLVVTLKLASCRVIEELDDFGILPQHVIEPMLDGNYAEIDNLEYNKNPSVTAGVFNFGALVPDEQTSLIRNENNWMPVSPGGLYHPQRSRSGSRRRTIPGRRSQFNRHGGLRLGSSNSYARFPRSRRSR